MSTIKTAIAIRHVEFEHAGTLAVSLSAADYYLIVVDAADPCMNVELLEKADLLVVLGAPIGAYEERAYPFLTTELRAIDARLRQDKPTLGICLGAQLIARALGARVYPASKKEIGWKPVLLTEAGRASPLRFLSDTPVLHWHGDTFDLPGGARSLASTEVCCNQALATSSNILGLQFHAEAISNEIERWLIGHAFEISEARLDPCDLRRDSLLCGERLRTAARQLFDSWLSGLS